MHICKQFPWSPHIQLNKNRIQGIGWFFLSLVAISSPAKAALVSPGAEKKRGGVKAAPRPFPVFFDPFAEDRCGTGGGEAAASTRQHRHLYAGLFAGRLEVGSLYPHLQLRLYRHQTRRHLLSPSAQMPWLAYYSNKMEKYYCNIKCRLPSITISGPANTCHTDKTQ